MKAIIPLAGKGTRLRPHTHAIPKPLVRVAGKPVLGHLLDQLEKYGIREVEFVVGHLRDKIEEYVNGEYPHFKFNFVEQKELKGTADAIKLVEPNVQEEMLIIFIDTLSNADFSVIKDLPNDVSGLIWAKEVENYQDFGVIVTGQDNLMTRIVEKPQEPVSKFANIGLYYIRDWKLLFEGIDHVLASEPGKGGEYFLTDAFQYMVSKGAKIKTLSIEGWYDCGQVGNLISTNRSLLEGGLALKPESVSLDVIINDPVRIEDGVILENSTVGPNVTLEKGSVVKNSTIRDSIVGRGTIVEGSDLKESLVGSDVVVKGASGSINVYDHSTIVQGE